MLPAELRAILFDAGGTLLLLDYEHIAESARRHGAAVEPAGLFRAEAEARFAIDRHARREGGLPGDDSARRPSYFETLLRAAGVTGDAVARTVAELEVAHAASNLWRVAVSDAAAVLQELRALGLRTGVVSNADGRIEASLARAGLAAHLDVVVDSQLEGVEKPDPGIFERALARLGVPAERSAYIGDIYSIDAVGARGAGLAPILIDPTGAYGAIDCPTISRLSELPRAVRGSKGGGS